MNSMCYHGYALQNHHDHVMQCIDMVTWCAVAMVTGGFINPVYESETAGGLARGDAIGQSTSTVPAVYRNSRDLYSQVWPLVYWPAKRQYMLGVKIWLDLIKVPSPSLSLPLLVTWKTDLGCHNPPFYSTNAHTSILYVVCAASDFSWLSANLDSTRCKSASVVRTECRVPVLRPLQPSVMLPPASLRTLRCWYRTILWWYMMNGQHSDHSSRTSFAFRNSRGTPNALTEVDAVAFQLLPLCTLLQNTAAQNL